VGRTACDQLEVKAFDVRLVKRDHVRPADLQITGSHTLHDHGAACHWDGLQFQALRLEESFFHGDKHGGVVHNFHITKLALRLSPTQSAREWYAGNADGQLSDELTSSNSHVTFSSEYGSNFWPQSYCLTSEPSSLCLPKASG